MAPIGCDRGEGRRAADLERCRGARPRMAGSDIRVSEGCRLTGTRGIAELRCSRQVVAGMMRSRLKAASRTGVQGQLRCRRKMRRRPLLIMRPTVCRSR